jgi:hypothetical protein
VNGRAFLFTGHEAESSFGIGIDMDTIEILKETDPDTFWQTPQYQGWPTVLVNAAHAEPERMKLLIERAWWDRASQKQRALRGGERP